MKEDRIWTTANLNRAGCRLDPGEEIVGSLTRLVEQESIQLASVSALGAANDVTIGIFNTVEKKYYPSDTRGTMKFPALVGNVTRKEGEPYLHLHIPSAIRSPARSMPATCPPPPSAPRWSCSSRCGTAR